MNNDDYSFGDFEFEKQEVTPMPKFDRSPSDTDTLQKGLSATPNPYAQGAALGLQVLSMKEKRKRAEEEAKALAGHQRLQRQMGAINNLMSMSQRLAL